MSQWKGTCLIPFGAALWSVIFAIAQAPASRVEGMQFISSANPQIRVKVDASLKYLGVVTFSIDDLAAGQRFVFVSADSRKHVRRMFIIQQEGFLPSSSEVYRYSIRNPFRLGRFDYWHSVALYDNEKDVHEAPGKEGDVTLAFLKSRGYTLEAELVMPRFARQADAAHKHEIIFFCYENLSAFGRKLADFPQDSDGDPTGPGAEEIKKQADQKCRAAFQVISDD